MFNSNEAIKHIKNIIDNTKEAEVIKDSDDILEELGNIQTRALNRDYCWGCKLKVFCDIKGNNLFCKGYYDILYDIEDIINERAINERAMRNTNDK